MQKLLPNCSLRDEISPQALQLLCSLGEIRTYELGEAILRVGEPADALLILLTGSARVVIDAVLVATLEQGELIGERMFAKHAFRCASVEALSPTTAMRIDRNAFHAFHRDQPHAAAKIRSICQQRLKRHDDENHRRGKQDRHQYLALVAHDAMKPRLIDFCVRHQDLLRRFPLLATDTTGTLIYQQTGLALARKVSSGPMGGDQAIGHLISTQNILALVFFRDPLHAHAHQSDISALARLCDVYEIPFATNQATAEMIVACLESYAMPRVYAAPEETRVV